MTASDSYRSLRRPAQVVIALLVLGLLVDAIAFGVEIDYYGVLGELERGVDLSLEEVEAAEDRSLYVALAQFVTYIAAIVAFVVWFHRAYRNLERLGTPGPRYKSGWAIGAWFVPILNLFRPKQITNDIWRAGDPSVARGEDGWRDQKVTALIHWWWALWITTGVVGNLSARAYLAAETLKEQLQASALSAGADLFFIVAAVLAILVVRAVTKRQQARAQSQAQSPPPPPPETPLLAPA